MHCQTQPEQMRSYRLMYNTYCIVPIVIVLWRLPLDSDNCWIDDFDDTACLVKQQKLTHLPIKTIDIQCETSSEPVLSKITILLFMGDFFWQV